MKALGYVRVSSEEQAKEGVSLEAQKAKIKLYAELKDLDLIGIVEDAGISAKNLKRPGVQRVLEMARNKEVDAVIILKLDRIFRNTVDALQTSAELDKWGVALHSIQENLDTKSAMGKFFFTLTAALAEMERNIVSERTEMALQHKKSKNERVGHIPFGFHLADDGIHLEEDENEQWILREIKILKDQGLSLRKIADELNNREIQNRGGIWNHVSVKRVAKL